MSRYTVEGTPTPESYAGERVGADAVTIAVDTAEGEYAFDDIAVDTVDDYGLMETWDFGVKEVTSDTFDNLDDDEIGISVELVSTVDGDDEETVGRIYNVITDLDDPTFSAGEWDEDGQTYEFTSALDEDELAALDEIYGTSTTLNSAMEVLAAAALAAAAIPASPLNKIKSPVIDEDAFDVFEEEEAAQTVVVSTTYEATTEQLMEI